jgi:hypothetical protein
VKALALVCLLAACAEFEDPTIVLDLRVIGMETTPPEQILDVDPMQPPTIDDILAQLQPIRVRALIAEPFRDGPVAWTLSTCILEDRGSRCVEGSGFEFASNVLSDPEKVTFGNDCKDEGPEPAGTLCATLVPDNRFVLMLYDALMADPAHGLGGIDIGFVLRVKDVINEPTTGEAFAAKRVRFAPRVPADRVANNNPSIVQLLLGQGGVGRDITKRHCADFGQEEIVDSEESVTFFPVAGPMDREEFVVPTLDGNSEHFTEYLEYQWLATAGNFVDDITGGPPDVFGNVRLDGTEWKAPKTDTAIKVTIWVLQRDSRYGVRWREACIRVVP